MSAPGRLEHQSDEHRADRGHLHVVERDDGAYQVGLIDELATGPFPSRRCAEALAATARPRAPP
ncbi:MULTISPECIES: hypothetical protein [Bradyrhizobium]|uniref:hypothetical protein n=1 Tax=Bradyrhizobium TaxID=374 RepID=UPI0012FE390B|nr:hypothetical protein [Bradyrhizobium liaoningense]